MKKKDITIITVCFNVGEKIVDTIEQVINQNIKDIKRIEHLIIDGKSTDNTLEIIKQYSKKYNHIEYISESDSGIYDAMNKGIQKSNGEIIYFLNVGDQFYDESVIERIIDSIECNDIIYGNTHCRYENRVEIVKDQKIDKLFFIAEKNICHQAMFIKKQAFNKVGKFNHNIFKYCADYDWLMRAYCNDLTIKYIDKDVVIYDMNGVSAQPSNRNKLISEREISIRDNLGVISYVIIKLKHRIGRFKRKLKVNQ